MVCFAFNLATRRPAGPGGSTSDLFFSCRLAAMQASPSAAAAQDTPKSTGALVWNVCAGDLFDDLEPDDTNTSFKPASGFSQDEDSRSISLSQMSGSGISNQGTGSMASSSQRDGPFPWGKPLEWLVAPPGLAPPGPVAGVVPPGSVAGKTGLWNATGRFDSASGATSLAVVATGIPAMVSLPSTAGQPGTPMVLWCEQKPTRQMEVVQALSGYFAGQQPQFVHFATQARFARWLFAQPRGEVAPWALLVVGWREAKPSAMAIGAAHSGNSSCLRPDARRPPLPAIIGNPMGKVHCAIGSVIIILEKQEQEERVIQWAQEDGRTMAGLDVHVVSGAASLNGVVTRMRAARHTAMCSPHGRSTMSL